MKPDFGDKTLDMELKEYDSYLSVGKQYLICIIRTLLKKVNFFNLDEISASIDYKINMMIQEIMGEI